MLIKQMQYSPLQTEKDRVSEWGSFRYAFFCCREILLYLSSPYKYGKMYKSPCKKKAGMGDEMTFRTSDILIGGSLIIIGLTEIAHLAGCLLGWSFLTVTDLLLAEGFIEPHFFAGFSGGRKSSAGGNIIVCNIQTDTETGHSR